MAFSFITLSSKSQSLDPATGLALSSTGNILNLGGGLPWSGTVTGSAGGFSGGPGPAYNPSTGNIIFSYGLNTASQLVAINTALANAGTGIQLSGYKYSWQINNDLYNGAGNRGTLTGNVSLIGSTGIVLESFNYDYNQNLPSFTTFSGTQLFNNRYDPSSLNGINVSFTGKDQNWWAGYYGPRVHVDNLSLLYTAKPVAVDPCIANPLSSPTCSGYALATVKNSILGSTVSGASVNLYIPATNFTSLAPALAEAAPALAEAAPALAQASPQQQQAVQQVAAQVIAQQDPNQNPSIAQDNPAQPSPQQAGPAPTSPQPAGGSPQTATASTSSSSAPSGGGSAGPSKLAMSVVRSAQDKDKATQAQAVQNAAKAFENTQQSAQAASNAAVSMNQDMSANSATAAAQFSSQATQASQQTTNQSGQGPQQFQQSTTHQQQTNRAVQTTQQTQGTSQQQTFDSSVTSSVALRAPVIITIDTPVQTSSGTGLTVNRNPFAYNPLATMNTSNLGTTPTQPAPVYQPRLQDRGTELDMPQVVSFSGVSKAGNPLSEIMMQQRFELLQGNLEQQSAGVNRNVLPNELAGGIDIASMASIPTGFNAYSFVLRDAAFYEPKEVYKNQRTVDNARVLRGLTSGSDAKHQEMIDQQYKLGQ